MKDNQIEEQQALTGQISFVKWFVMITAAVFMGNLAFFAAEKLVNSACENKTKVQSQTTSIDAEARKVLQALGVTPPVDISQESEVSPAQQAQQKRKQLIAAKAECDAWSQKLAEDNSAVNRMSKNRACQQVGFFMNKVESGQQ